MSGIKFAYTGDLVLQQSSKYPESTFKPIITMLESKGVERLIVNLESPVITPSMKRKKNKICLHCFEEDLKHLTVLKPQTINLSNNHINDYGNDSIKYTKQKLEKYNFFGVGYDADSSHIEFEHEKKIINFYYSDRSSDQTGERLFAENDKAGPKEVSFDELKRYKKSYPDYCMIVNIHWGTENIKVPDPEIRVKAKKMIDIGVSLIIGHHPHIIQPIEKYKDAFIFYSLGNFFFQELEVEEKGRRKYSLIPKKHQRIGIIPIVRINTFDPRIEIENIISVKWTGDVILESILKQKSWGSYKLNYFHLIAYPLLRLWSKYSFKFKCYFNYFKNKMGI
jgi:poly-gamma-glutamate synthesis protein (capsule biosynthesis protein)